MVSDIKVKRLLKQASVSVLAGFVMSSAVMAEDMINDAGEAVEISIGYESVELEGMIDPMPSDIGDETGGQIDTGEPADKPDVPDVPEDIGVIDGEPDAGCTDCSVDDGVIFEPMPIEGEVTTTNLNAGAELGAGVNAPAENHGFRGDRQNDRDDDRGERGHSGGLPKFLLR